MIYTKNLEWKSFRVETSDFHLWLLANATGYTGMSANAHCQIHFSNTPSDDTQARVDQYWNSLTEGEETAKTAYREHLERVVEYAKANLPYVDFLQMIAAEKKLFMGRDLDLQDKENLAQKYPNV
jgi:hypothetical protein